MTQKTTNDQSHLPNPQNSGSLLLKEDKQGSKVLHVIPEGTSGTDISGGRFYEEYLDALSSTQGADIWDEMRRSDDQVSMLLRVVKNPIMSARWFIESADDSDEEKKIADFVSHALFKDMGSELFPKTFDKFKREALTSAEFGYSLFEITNKIVYDDPEFGTYVGIKGLDWRSPKTIEEWHVLRSGYLESVRQLDTSELGGDFTIDGQYILHIAPEMEGDNYEGISMLRPIYGNWVRKDVLRKLQMIGVERAATGVPIGVIPIGQINTPSQTALENSLSRFVSHERQYMTIPEGMNIDSLKIEHDAEKVEAAIAAEDRGMAKSFLAGFLELGLSGGGAFALGTDWSDLFLSGLTVYADAVRSPVNIKLIPHLVKANYGKRKNYPELKIEGINDKAGKEFAEVLGILKDKDLIQVTDRLKAVVHKRYNIPDFDKDLEPDLLPEPAVKAEKHKPDPEGEGEGEGEDQKLSEQRFILSEKNVSGQISKAGKALTEEMQKGMLPRAQKLVDSMMKIWKNSPKSKRMHEVNRLQVPGKDDYKKMITKALAVAYVESTEQVKMELSSDGFKLAEPTEAEIKDLPAASKATGKSQAELLVESQDADLKKNLFFSFTAKADTLPTESQMKANLIRVVERYITGPGMLTAGPNAVANAVNLARNAIFQKEETLQQIESFQFTNPSPRAPICRELTGRVFTKDEYLTTDFLPPLHHGCNSYITAQVFGDTKNKPVSPAGLTIQGTDEQITEIKKSIKF